MSKFLELQDKWMALSKRERWMIFGAGFIAVLGIMDTFLLDPLRQQNIAAQQDIVRLQTESTKAQEKTTALLSGTNGGGSSKQNEINALNEKIKQQNEAMTHMSALMVKPNDMLPLLKSLLTEQDAVEVVNLASLPVDNFIKKHVESATDNGANKEDGNQTLSSFLDGDLNQVYQHTVKLTVRGDYLAVMRYAQALKKHADVLSWESAEMKSQYPKTELTIHLYTLSMQNAWLGI